MKKDEIMEMLDNEIEALINELGETEPGTEKHESITKDLERLYKLRIEETKVVEDAEIQREKIDIDRDVSEYKAQIDVDINTDKLAEERRQHKIDKIFNGCEIGAHMALYALLVWCGFRFEEHGTFTSPTFKNIWRGIRSKKLD